MLCPITNKIYHLYIIPLFVILIIRVSPIISITEIAETIPSNTLKVSPICSKIDTIFLSAIGSLRAEVRLNKSDMTASFIIGTIHIDITTNIPYESNCIF